jgi:ribosomal protein S18 acetylase RimI-like enzyme
MEIRRAQPGDEQSIARIQVDTWRHTYAGIVPDSFYEVFTYTSREQAWQKALNTPGRDTFVATEGNQVVGFCAVGPDRSENEKYDAELYALYVAPLWHGRGAGKLLFDAGVDALRSKGHFNMQLWVLADNLTGRRFYERQGGKLLGEKQLELSGVWLSEVAYGWSLARD